MGLGPIFKRYHSQALATAAANAADAAAWCEYNFMAFITPKGRLTWISNKGLSVKIESKLMFEFTRC